MDHNQFNIRVYGLLIREDSILVTDEFRLGILMTKFPGGALEFGEGTLDCLKREFLEELNTRIEVIRHFYTTDFYQPTELLPSTMQLLGIYYVVSAKPPFGFQTTTHKFDFPELVEGAQCFRWIKLKQLSEDEVTFPVDKKVVRLLHHDLHNLNT